MSSDKRSLISSVVFAEGRDLYIVLLELYFPFFPGKGKKCNIISLVYVFAAVPIITLARGHFKDVIRHTCSKTRGTFYRGRAESEYWQDYPSCRRQHFRPPSSYPAMAILQSSHPSMSSVNDLDFFGGNKNKKSPHFMPSSHSSFVCGLNTNAI